MGAAGDEKAVGRGLGQLPTRKQPAGSLGMHADEKAAGSLGMHAGAKAADSWEMHADE
jgi:hypothetical protein